MGVDFIRQRAKAFRKSWDSHRVELTKRTLFTREPDCIVRAAVARMIGLEPIEIGSRLLLRLDEGKLVALKGTTTVAVFVNPPTSAIEAIERTGGYAKGEVITAGHVDGLAEITIC
jgi:hypothetical protein